MGDRTNYENPLAGRYASPEMRRLFSDETKFRTWRRLWLALARAEKDLGLPISAAQIEELAAHLDDIDFEAADALEREAPPRRDGPRPRLRRPARLAGPIIHLGATSCFVTDNTDL